MIGTLETEAEKLAEKAEELPAFSGIKLLHIKRQVAALLSLIGRDGIFDEYTKHDISHIDESFRNNIPFLRKLRAPLQDYVNLTELNDAIKSTRWKIFDPSAWAREDIFR
jgi:hypothetical protein